MVVWMIMGYRTMSKYSDLAIAGSIPLEFLLKENYEAFKRLSNTEYRGISIDPNCEKKANKL